MGICMAEKSASKSIDFMRNKKGVESELLEEEQMESNLRGYVFH
jgi:hypothetical protein